MFWCVPCVGRGATTSLTAAAVTVAAVQVQDPKATVTAHFSAILQELLRAMSSENWRERKAGCAGMTDLIRGRSYKEIGVHVEPLWGACLRAIDDIKDSVRDEAVITLKTLGKLTVRRCARRWCACLRW